MWWSTRGAPPVVVVTWNRSGARRATMPSSRTKPLRSASCRSGSGRGRDSRGVGVNAVQEFGGVGPTTSILPSVEASKMPTALRTARHSRATAACISSPRGGNSARVSRCRHPRTPRRAQRPNRARCLADRVEQVAARGSGKGAERHRRIRNAERGVADPRDRPCRGFGDHRQRVHVGRLALVGGHAGGGVALHVLDRAEALAVASEVLGSDVVLEIDEGLAAGGVGSA